jgi:16S rRNA (guanine527-N7)-methyltransferase
MDRHLQVDTFSRCFQVSRETIISLNNFEKIIIKANKSMNLIGKSTIKDIWHRHFLDSFQLIDFIDKNDKTLLDIGSGAGFPGLVLAIAAKDKKIPLKVRLIEKSRKKVKFLEKTIKELNLRVQVINENVLEHAKTLKDDILVARAFKPLSIILKLIHNKAINWKKIIIFQGKTGKIELLEASKTWDIEYKQRVSITNSDSMILEINKLKKK